MEDIRKYPTDDEAKELIISIGKRMYERGFVASNDGNLSCKVSDTEIWATPTGVSKGFMTPEMLIKTDLSGNVIEGDRKPSSELKMHLRCYAEDPEITGVVHAHPEFSTAFACAGLPLDSRVLAEGIVQLGYVPCAPFALPGTQEVPDSIGPFIKDHNAVLLANHGALTWGSSLMQAYMRLESLEFYAKQIMYTRYIMKTESCFTEDDVDRLIDIRENRLGIKKGGRPS
ncbi:MAG: class II aldolase/adducin family protein [Lachnospiraceae bacterium]|nr:class II aldolase/adducin family protein [Lachnospiraceae bacterium]